MTVQEKSSVVSNPPPQQDTAEGAKESRNRANITALRDFVASAKFTFDMSDPVFEPNCGSAGCIGGHAAALWPNVAINFRDERRTFDDPKVARKLGISRDAFSALCYPRNIDWNSINRQTAIRVLTTLAETGEVVWPKHPPESP